MDLNLNMFALSAESSPHWSLMICVLFFHTTPVGLNSRCNQHLVTQFHLMAITSSATLPGSMKQALLSALWRPSGLGEETGTRAQRFDKDLWAAWFKLLNGGDDVSLELCKHRHDFRAKFNLGHEFSFWSSVSIWALHILINWLFHFLMTSTDIHNSLKPSL